MALTNFVDRVTSITATWLNKIDTILVNVFNEGSTILSINQANIGDVGTEGAGINISGVTYESTFKISDIDGTNYAQNIIHRHSTTLEPLILGARSNSNTSAHTDVSSGQNVFTIYAAGWAGSNYKLFGSCSFAAGTGTISDTSAPGRFIVSTTANGAVLPTERLRITQAGYVGIGTTTPTSILHVVGIPVYANNAAAIAGGLTAGALYRTGADPDPVCVVH